MSQHEAEPFQKKEHAADRQPGNDLWVRFPVEGCATYWKALAGSSVPEATDFVAREIASWRQLKRLI